MTVFIMHMASSVGFGLFVTMKKEMMPETSVNKPAPGRGRRFKTLANAIRRSTSWPSKSWIRRSILYNVGATSLSAFALTFLYGGLMFYPLSLVMGFHVGVLRQAADQ